jgi:hypothetical protein
MVVTYGHAQFRASPARERLPRIKRWDNAMSKITILPPLEIERVTALLEAGAWCKSPEMELVLAETIKRFINPPMLFNDPGDDLS